MDMREIFLWMAFISATILGFIVFNHHHHKKRKHHNHHKYHR